MTDFGNERRELTSAQRGIWFAQLLDPLSPALNVASVTCSAGWRTRPRTTRGHQALADVLALPQ
jgi:hypothetical protein